MPRQVSSSFTNEEEQRFKEARLALVNAIPGEWQPVPGYEYAVGGTARRATPMFIHREGGANKATVKLISLKLPGAINPSDRLIYVPDEILLENLTELANMSHQFGNPTRDYAFWRFQFQLSKSHHFWF